MEAEGKRRHKSDDSKKEPERISRGVRRGGEAAEKDELGVDQPAESGLRGKGKLTCT